MSGLDASIKTPVDPNGRLESAKLGEVTATQDAMNGMAAGTGGRALRNQNYFDQWIDTVLDETSDYYLLGWRLAGEDSSGKLLNVKVSILGKPDLTVRAASGYIAGSRATANPPVSRTPDEELRDALAGTVSGNSFSLLLALTYLNTPKNEILLTPWMQLDSTSLTYGSDGSQPASARIAGVILNDKGKVVTSFKNQLNVNPLKSPTGSASGITYSHPMVLSAGTYEVRVAARDERSGRIGNAVQWIVIPDLTKHQLALSSLLLGGQVFDTGKDDSPQVQLSVDHRFPRTSNLGYWGFVYNPGRDASGSTNLTVETHIVQDGKPLPITQHKLVSASTDPAGIPFGENISMKNLAPGRYQLRVIVSDHAAGSTAAQTADFEIPE